MKEDTTYPMVACGKDDCKYNKSASCTNYLIYIGWNKQCTSYEKKQGRKTDND